MLRTITYIVGFLIYFLVTADAGLSREGNNFVVADSTAANDDVVCKVPAASKKLADAERKIMGFLEEQPEDQAGKFHVQGWRWHTMSLLREAKRLKTFATKLSTQDNNDDSMAKLKQASDYVIGFNMKGLHNIEKDLFFPWMRQQVKKSIHDSDIAKAFDTVMDQLESDRKKIESIGAQLTAALKNSSNVRSSSQLVADKSAAIAESAQSMLKREESILVPTVARFVSESDQKSFNSKVIRKLGVWDSRLHLVGMYEAVWSLEDKEERKLFEETIPSIPQMMIPRWKRLIYEPQAGMMDTV